jgi:chorismate mutase
MSELEAYRKQIRAINTELLNLLKKRFEVVKKVGVYKIPRGIPIRNVEIEESQIQILRKQGRELGLDEDFVEAFFRQIIAHAVRLEEEMQQ